MLTRRQSMSGTFLEIRKLLFVKKAPTPHPRPWDSFIIFAKNITFSWVQPNFILCHGCVLRWPWRDIITHIFHCMKKITCVNKILCDYVYIIIMHLYIIILHVYINILHVYIIILHVYILIILYAYIILLCEYMNKYTCIHILHIYIIKYICLHNQVYMYTYLSSHGYIIRYTNNTYVLFQMLQVSLQHCCWALYQIEEQVMTVHLVALRGSRWIVLDNILESNGRQAIILSHYLYPPYQLPITNHQSHLSLHGVSNINVFIHDLFGHSNNLVMAQNSVLEWCQKFTTIVF